MLQHFASNQVAASALSCETKGSLLYHSDAKVLISERNTKFNFDVSLRARVPKRHSRKGTNKRANKQSDND